MTTKNKKTPAKKAGAIEWHDRDGNVQYLDPPDVQRYQDTEAYQSNGLYPGVTQAVFLRQGGIYDENGKPSLTGVNLILLDVTHMKKSQFGPWYLMHVIAEDNGEPGFSGEFTVPAKGETVADALQRLSGIELATGREFNSNADLKKGPVACRIVFDAGAGDFEGYYTLVGHAEPVEAS